MVDNSCIIEGNVKFRDGKKWKTRWCVMRKLSPVADCLHLQLYGDSKDRFKQGHTKASLSLQHFLGVKSGFTLDKESNTIAIICQDLIVVLAFDTRERLIQWQVKISTNLGEDQQFLVIISSTPSKAKVSSGVAQLHIQDSRFCLTIGVPPRLVGVWEIGNLRRYGVVEGRFCFEGGSRCGRGEGLHVLITDQGEDIVKTIQLAADSKLSSRKRTGRDISSQESPRRFTRSDTRVSDFFPQTLYSTTNLEDHDSDKATDTSSCWFSTEHRQQSEDAEKIDSLSDWKSASLPRAVQKCTNCTSDNTESSSTSSSSSTSNQHRNLHYQPRDRLSLSSFSSSSHESDSCQNPESVPSLVSPNIPLRPVVGKKKPPMPLPTEQVCTCKALSARKAPYENYDVPRTILAHHMSLEPPTQSDQYYDTPRKIKECLALPKRYPNYDIPQAVQKCGCPVKNGKLCSTRPTGCPCHNIISWAGFVLPYCRRGAGIEPTGVAVRPIKLSGEGKMPVVNANGALSIYVNNFNKEPAVVQKGNYENVEPVIETQPEPNRDATYVNVNFQKSLEYYENSRELVVKAGYPIETDNGIDVDRSPNGICNKCGHLKEGDTVEDQKKIQDYLSMQPLILNSPGLKSRLCTAKSSSHPTLTLPGVEAGRKQSDCEQRISGSAMLSSPYLRRRLDEKWRKRSYSAESTNYDYNFEISIHKCASETHKTFCKNPYSNVHMNSKDKVYQNCDDPLPISIKIRRSSSVPSKTGHNRDSSSSNDSGVSTGSLAHRNGDEGDIPIQTKMKQIKIPSCYHSSLPRKSKSSDPLRELSFRFQKVQIPAKSTSAEAEIPNCLPHTVKGYSPGETLITPYIDSRSTSSGTSDMSDYIETLSLSSQSSSDTPDILRLGVRTVAVTLRPRSGKEYYKLDRSMLATTTTTTPISTTITSSPNTTSYVNITSVLEKSESPSPGYMSSSPFEQPQTSSRSQFLFLEET